MTEFKAIIGIWLLAQIFIVFIFIGDKDKRVELIVDFVAFSSSLLLIVMYFGLKLIGV